jgi:hypothetical protein
MKNKLERIWKEQGVWPTPRDAKENDEKPQVSPSPDRDSSRARLEYESIAVLLRQPFPSILPRFILILSFHLRVCLTSVPLPSRFLVNNAVFNTNRRFSVIVSASRGGSEGEGNDARADGKGYKRIREERGKEIKLRKLNYEGELQ